MTNKTSQPPFRFLFAFLKASVIEVIPFRHCLAEIRSRARLQGDRIKGFNHFLQHHLINRISEGF